MEAKWNLPKIFLKIYLSIPSTVYSQMLSPFMSSMTTRQWAAAGQLALPPLPCFFAQKLLKIVFSVFNIHPPPVNNDTYKVYRKLSIHAT